jgi:hypothetical protein
VGHGGHQIHSLLPVDGYGLLDHRGLRGRGMEVHLQDEEAHGGDDEVGGGALRLEPQHWDSRHPVVVGLGPPWAHEVGDLGCKPRRTDVLGPKRP